MRVTHSQYLADVGAKKLIIAAKAEAGRRILEILPDWKQRNLTARAVEIVNAKYDQTATSADLVELSDIAEIFAQVKAIRSASDLIEGDIAAGLVTTTDQVKKSSRWPSIK